MPTVPRVSAVPLYLSRTYHWAYLDRRTLPWLDRSLVVSAILWGNAGRLMQAAAEEFQAGQRLLQAACVYGPFSRMLAEQVGGEGDLEVIDVAPIQVANVRRKLDGLPQAQARQGDLAAPDTVDAAAYDAVCCFFLLHEVPPIERACIVHNLLGAVRPGGKIVFVDYHRTHPWHPLRPIMAQVFRWLEPFADSLLDTDIPALSAHSGDFEWKKTTLFGGLYQKLVGVRRG
ncbi:rhodoquinone biosynthesis methyltransferase RquA [Azoarcus sp. KH32C]|uniref:rhodoquinone biosynthesis methyltransferase RquA n=1 Tax=Azoarcus sp. KH32C TaxID=748247 RepID=UPI00023868AA|nr:methyltransferase [Azoarcus sp. KH32C]